MANVLGVWVKVRPRSGEEVVWKWIVRSGPSLIDAMVRVYIF